MASGRILSPRLPQNTHEEPPPSRKRIKIDVMRNPLMTKKRSTSIQPPMPAQVKSLSDIAVRDEANEG